MTHTAPTPVARGTDPLLTTLRAFAVLTVVNLLFQFLTAGELFGRDGGESFEEFHATGAIVLHVVSGLAMIAAFALWRLRGLPLWPGVLAAVVFVLGFVQAYFGGRSTLYIHVPGAMILTVGAVWVMVWSFTPTARAVD